MVWFFTRGDQELGLETRRDPATHEFILEWRNADGTTKTERFSDQAAFRAYLEAVEARLLKDEWTRVDPPLLLRGDWQI